MKVKELSYKGRVVFKKVTMPLNFKRLPKYFVETESCFLYVDKGNFQYRTPNKLLSFEISEGLLSKCGNFFIEQSTANNPIEENEELTVFAAYFFPDIIKEFFVNDLSLEQLTLNYDATKVPVAPLLKSTIESIDFMLENSAIADDNLVATKIKELIILLSKSEQSNSLSTFIATLFSPYEYDFKEIIESNLYTNLSLSELAHLTNCSLATFKRKFTSVYNESPGKYFLQKKVEYACQLLKRPSYAIADVAFDCGFETVNNFNRMFKKTTGKSPTEYRKMHLSLNA